MFSRAEVSKHNTEKDCHIIIDRVVYDVTSYLTDHPGGKNSITQFAGRDASNKFHLIHDVSVIEQYAERFAIGRLHDGESEFDQEPPPPPPLASGKLAEAEKLKNEGNQAYRDGDYNRAIGRYGRAFVHIVQRPHKSDVAAVAIAVTLNLNIAAAYVALSDWHLVIEYCDRALALDGKNAKGLFRRGMAYTGIGELDNAEADLSLAITLSGGADAAINRAMATVKSRRKARDQKRKQLFTNAFDGK